MTPSKPLSRSPRRITSRTGALSFSHGVSSENRCRLASTWSVWWKYEVSRPAHGASAPSLSERAGFGTSRSGSISSREPMPPHSGHAPYGLLNENMRGETSGKEIPQSAHASFSENVVVAGAVRPPWTEGGLLSTRPGSAPAVLPVVRNVPSVREVPSAPATVSTVTMPSARRSAVSSESARREPRFSRTISRSTTTSIVCLRFLSSSMSSPTSRIVPLTRTREYPWRCRSKKSFLYSPLRPRMTGASTSSRVPDGCASTRSTICWTVCAAITRSQLGQVVVDLGDGAHGRAGILRRGLLLYGNGGRETFDRVHLRLFHLLEELTRIGRKRLDVATLALRVDRVEGER